MQATKTTKGERSVSAGYRIAEAARYMGVSSIVQRRRTSLPEQLVDIAAPAIGAEKSDSTKP
jgi:hypothetical protein